MPIKPRGNNHGGSAADQSVGSRRRLSERQTRKFSTRKNSDAYEMTEANHTLVSGLPSDVRPQLSSVTVRPQKSTNGVGGPFVSGSVDWVCGDSCRSASIRQRWRSQTESESGGRARRLVDTRTATCSHHSGIARRLRGAVSAEYWLLRYGDSAASNDHLSGRGHHCLIHVRHAEQQSQILVLSLPHSIGGVANSCAVVQSTTSDDCTAE